jgi:KipI family sensor histidine kinase inhibitor
MDMERFHIGDGCICWSLGDDISLETSARVLGIYRSLKTDDLMKKLLIHDLVPSYNALAVHYDPVHSRLDAIIEKVEQIIDLQLSGDPDLSVPAAKKVVIPVDYSGEDLSRVAEINGLSLSDVIKLHAGAIYTVAMVGFLPHFPYLIGLDKRLETPRLDSPRKVVPAGSVAIGGAQTGIYPSESPGGWNILGQTDPALLIPIEPGDMIEFEPMEQT